MGQKRRELVRRVGYDAKNAAHLIRLLRMGIEFLIEGTMHVERADAPELLDIKRGEWPLEKVKAEAERLFQLSQEFFSSYLPRAQRFYMRRHHLSVDPRRTTLPKVVDQKKECELRRVRRHVKHRLAAESATGVNSIKSSDQSPVLVPCLDAVRDPDRVKL